ncbi:MAG: TIGR03790 family protein [Cyanobium sp.]
MRWNAALQRRYLYAAFTTGILITVCSAVIWRIAHNDVTRPGLADHSLTTVGPLEGRDLALVINSADPLSEAIGSYYQNARHIPSNQVIRVRFAPGRSSLPVAEFRRIRRQVEQQTPEHVQIYALAWSSPWSVGCQSITSAFSLGYRPEVCFGRCGTARLSPYYARGDVRRPWAQLRLRPSMLLAATNLAAAHALIDRGVAADGTKPPGTAYLLSTSDPLRNVRSGRFDVVAAELGRQLRVRHLWGDVLKGAPDVIAYFTGLTIVPDIASNHYRPGAVADHLTSTGGMLTGASGQSSDGGNGQMSSLRWLEAGATGSYGTVVEPCNATTKFPDPGLLLSYYRRGDTLIESYWRSVAMPDQGIFIGEPLARPWGPKPGRFVRPG